MSTNAQLQVQIRLATTNDIEQLKELYSKQYPDNIQKEFKSIAKYMKKALKTDLNDINKHYLSKPKHGLWVAVDVNNPNIIIC